MKRPSLITGASIAAMSAVALMGFTAANAQAYFGPQGNLGARINACVEQRLASWNRHMSLSEHAALRLQFRLCIHNAIDTWFGGGHSSMSSSMNSSATSMSSSSSSISTSTSSMSSTGSSVSSVSSTGSSVSSLSSSTSTGSSMSSNMSQSSMSSSGAMMMNVTINDNAFSPQAITVTKGSTVHWTNNDDVYHTVSSTTAGGPHSGILGNGSTYSYTFMTKGTYTYYSLLHPSANGTVVVTE